MTPFIVLIAWACGIVTGAALVWLAEWAGRCV